MRARKDNLHWELSGSDFCFHLSLTKSESTNYFLGWFNQLFIYSSPYLFNSRLLVIMEGHEGNSFV